MSGPLLEQLGIGYYVDPSILDGVQAAWMIAGVISIACFTIGLNSTLVMVEDKERRTINDFIASPLKPRILWVSYFISAFLITFFLTLLVTVLGFIYLGAATNLALSFTDFLLVVGILALSCLSSVAFMLCVMSFFKTNSTSAAFTGIFSAIIGFLIGAYIPMGMLPVPVQSFTGLIPGTHTSTLLRVALINQTYQTAELPQSVLNTLNEFFSLEINLFGWVVPQYLMYIYLAASAALFGVVFFLINRVLYKRKRKSA